MPVFKFSISTTLVPLAANVMGAEGVPDRASVNGAYCPVEISTVWPGFTTSAACWMVQNGVDCVPPVGLQVFNAKPLT